MEEKTILLLFFYMNRKFINKHIHMRVTNEQTFEHIFSDSRNKSPHVVIDF